MNNNCASGGPGVAPGKEKVLLNDVLAMSCVAVYTKYKWSDQGGFVDTWSYVATCPSVLEQCLKSKCCGMLKVFCFCFFFTLALYIVNLQAFIYFERQFFKPNASAAASFSKGTKQVHRDSLLHNPLLYLVGCSAWNLWLSWLGTIGLFRFGTPADTLQLGLSRAVCVYRYTSKWKLWSF